MKRRCHYAHYRTGKSEGWCRENHNGGKSTAASLAIGLSRQGKKVLLVDADAQGNLTQLLGWEQPDDLNPTLATIMTKIITDQPFAPQDGILHHADGVDLMPANIELSAIEVTLVNTMSRETVLRQYLSTVQKDYDYAIVDCMRPIPLSFRCKPTTFPPRAWSSFSKRRCG